MILDVQTIILVLLATVLGTAVAVPVIMGRHVSRAARMFQASLIVQALAWASFVASRYLADRWLSTLCMIGLSASFLLIWQALQGWLRHRPGRAVLIVLAVLTPAGYGWFFADYALRVGWVNFGLAAQLVLLCVTVAWPAPHASRRWRGLLFICMATLAVVTTWRGVLGAFFTAVYPFYHSAHPVNVAAALLYHVALALSTLAMLVAWREEAERELQQRAHTDPLTGLLNRKAFAERAEGLIARARRYKEPLSAVMIDIDHFKRLNDSHGHAAGDAALQTVARALKGAVRKGDLVARHGGEEFCVLLAHADPSDVVNFDRRLREALRTQAAPSPVTRGIDFSAGAALLIDADATLDMLLRRADQMLYRAKDEGRGRLVQA